MRRPLTAAMLMTCALFAMTSGTSGDDCFRCDASYGVEGAFYQPHLYQPYSYNGYESTMYYGNLHYGSGLFGNGYYGGGFYGRAKYFFKGRIDRFDHWFHGHPLHR